MKKFKYIGGLVLLLIIVLCTGCKQDDMENIDIIVTNYAGEYITKELYGKHSNIQSTYPDGVDIDHYKITSKQRKDYSKKGLFIYNGLIEKERDIAVELLDLNSNLKIIDTAYILEEEYSPVELWLNPSSLLMMAKNVQLGLNEYVTSNYLQKDINSAYEKLKVKLSELDANYRIAVRNTKDKTIIVNGASLKYLEKFGLNIICIDDDASLKTIDEVKELIQNESIRYIYNFEGEDLGNNATFFLNTYPGLKEIKLHKIDNLTDKEREDQEDYITLMNKNLDLLKQEMYQ